MPDKQRFSTIDEYISTFPQDTQAALEKVRQSIHKAAPDAVETISYDMPTFDKRQAPGLLCGLEASYIPVSDTSR